MSGLQGIQPYPGIGFAFGDRKRAVSAQRAPRQNHLLAGLSPEDYERLLPHLAPVPLPLGWLVHSAGDRERYLYFPTEGIVSRRYVMENGASAGFTLTGREGAIGIASFLGGDSTPSQAVVQSAGYAYRLGAEVLKKEFEHCGPLRRLLLRYTLALVAETGQTAVCNRHHSVEQQLCRLVLSTLDRLPGNELTITQQLIADTLGVRRESVTQFAGNLQKAGLIHCSHGHITVLDRLRLEARVCECYAVVKREYERLLRPENVFANARVAGERLRAPHSA